MSLWGVWSMLEASNDPHKNFWTISCDMDQHFYELVSCIFVSHAYYEVIMHQEIIEAIKIYIYDKRKLVISQGYLKCISVRNPEWM